VIRITGNRVYEITLSIDELQVAQIERDGATLIEQKLDIDMNDIAVPVELDGGIGHVVYKSVRITAKPADN